MQKRDALAQDQRAANRVDLKGPREASGIHGVEPFLWSHTIDRQGAGRVHNEMKGSLDCSSRHRCAKCGFVFEDQRDRAGAMQRCNARAARILGEPLNKCSADRSTGSQHQGPITRGKRGHRLHRACRVRRMHACQRTRASLTANSEPDPTRRHHIRIGIGIGRLRGRSVPCAPRFMASSRCSRSSVWQSMSRDRSAS